MNILLIEDNHAISQAYKSILEAADHVVDAYANPLVAVSKILRSNYDLMLIDLMLPEINGDELVRRIRNQGIDTPIVITTNMASGYDTQDLKNLGVAEIVLKSKTGPEELRQLVAKYTDK